MMGVEVDHLARPHRSVPAALVAVVALAGLLVAGWWLQPRLDQAAPLLPSTPPPSTSPDLTSPTVTVAPGRPGQNYVSDVDSPGITKTADTAQLDAIAVTRRSVWIAAGGLVVQVDPVAGRTLVVPGIETIQPPVVQLAAGAGAVWATTTGGRQLLRIDPGTARVTVSLQVPAQGSPLLPAGCGWCAAKPVPGGGSPTWIRPAAGS
jgi:hypothetical protein